MNLPRRRWPLAVAVTTAAALTLAACSGDPIDAPQETPDVEGLAEAQSLVSEYPREETVFTSGAQWGPPSSWNPIPQSGEATGVRGLLYEPLFSFDPATLELEPWLAERGEWTDADTYVLTLRDGLTWQDGEVLDAEDVVFTVELGKVPDVRWSNLWTWLSSVTATDATTVTFEFSDPRYQEWDNFLYTSSVLPQHIVSTWAETDYNSNANEDPIGSGAFRYSTHGQDRMVWERNDDWWGTEALGLEFPMTYVVDIVNPSNEVALGLLLQGGLDLSNNFLPGVQTLADSDKLGTYFDEAPYMLSANTAVLVPNATRAPMDDAEFRRAMAFAIDVDKIVANAYGGIVQKAHPTGLLPAYSSLYDKAVVDEHGFEYDADEAASILAAAGYEDTDGDGFVETPEGEKIELDLIVPAGWTDWMESARVIAEDLQAAGIDVTADFPDSGAVDDARSSGDFDLLINNWAGLSNTPWTYYNYLFHQPVRDLQLVGNFGRVPDAGAWALVEQLSRTASDSPEYARIMGELQEMSLTQMPMIPLWYNGLWAQYNTSTWGNWPTDGGDSTAYPSTWGGFWQMGGLRTLAALQPAG
ncbi:ABC transporter substrate-binding protein [Cellulomonas sp. zg-ZUI199]|uniref:ABC transporter substrate-binding protein n=1 Tax=Cellulomonas wangleii TaxID=2816956 RepID=A0ABX8D826_9CELL|nr:ABC transporter substrate-binding protein [Cellulomonas wangleii]MBO0924986.1 ABC transporter substrate-binding protein [Cellulomonas wangleii]QVI63592.1 ABC transporter substrate-binding protein [Cellulomonas wangleii]